VQCYRSSALDRASPAPVAAGTSAEARWFLGVTSCDGRLASGLWDCTAGSFHIEFTCDEFVYILDGEVIVRDLTTNDTHVLRGGDVAFFPLGSETHWEVKNYVRKVYVHRYAQAPVWKRAIGKAKRVLSKLPIRIPGIAQQAGAEASSPFGGAR